MEFGLGVLYVDQTYSTTNSKLLTAWSTCRMRFTSGTCADCHRARIHCITVHVRCAGRAELGARLDSQNLSTVLVPAQTS